MKSKPLEEKKILKIRHTWRDEIEEAVGVFLAFHDYYKNTEDKGENDGCLDLLIEKVIHVASHKKKYRKVINLTEIKL